jgi:GT2 family glycosyltransferase
VVTPAADLSLVVVAYHRPACLERLLEGLDGTGIAIVVVDVEADREIDEISRRHSASVVTIEGNPGYAAAVNAGARAVETEYLVFSNDDVIVPADSLEALGAALRDGSADVAVPRVQDDHGSQVRTVQSAPGLGRFLAEWVLLPDRPLPLPGIRIEKWRQPSGQELIGAASAMVVATRTSLLRERKLPEAYTLYWEESEWFHWLRIGGFSVAYCPEALITDLGGRAVLYPDKCRLLARNAVRYFRRTRGRLQAAVAWVLVIVWQLRLVAMALVRVALRRPGSSEALRCRVAGLGAAAQAWREVTAHANSTTKT